MPAPSMTIGAVGAGEASQSADPQATAAQVRSLSPALVGEIVAPLVAGLAALQVRAQGAGMTTAEAQIVRALAATARLWGRWLRDPAALART